MESGRTLRRSVDFDNDCRPRRAVSRAKTWVPWYCEPSQYHTVGFDAVVVADEHPQVSEAGAVSGYAGAGQSTTSATVGPCPRRRIGVTDNGGGGPPQKAL